MSYPPSAALTISPKTSQHPEATAVFRDSAVSLSGQCGLWRVLRAPMWTVVTPQGPQQLGSQSSLFLTSKAGGCTCLLPRAPWDCVPSPAGRLSAGSVIKDRQLPSSGPRLHPGHSELFKGHWPPLHPPKQALGQWGWACAGSRSPQPLQGMVGGCESPGVWSALSSQIQVTVCHPGFPFSASTP